jgi:hypothetical protein
MTAALKLDEQLRFNALTPEAARAIMEAAEGKPYAIRSCWYCNSAHEHLKDADYPIFCLTGCGIKYLRGFPLRVLALRMDGQELTDEMMNDFEKGAGRN